MEYEADKRSYRVLKLFETLQKLGQGAALDRKEFAEEMGVSERSVQRDIRTINEYLSDCGNSSEIVYDRQRNGYRLCREDTCFLDKGEILAICKILIESRAFSKAELKSLLNRLLHSMISKDTQKEIENYIRNELFYYIDPAHAKADLQLLWRVEEAIHHCRILHISYEKKDGTAVERRIWPVGILFSEYYFYMMGVIDDEEGHRNFMRRGPAIYRFDRIRDVEETEERFDGNITRQFKEGEFKNKVQFMYGGDLQKVEFLFEAPSPESVLDRLPPAEIKEVWKEASSGRKRYHVSAYVRGNGILMWLRSQGSRVEILSPRTLRDDWITDAEKLLAAVKKKSCT